MLKLTIPACFCRYWGTEKDSWWPSHSKSCQTVRDLRCGVCNWAAAECDHGKRCSCHALPSFQQTCLGFCLFSPKGEWQRRVFCSKTNGNVAKEPWPVVVVACSEDLVLLGQHREAARKLMLMLPELWELGELVCSALEFCTLPGALLQQFIAEVTAARTSGYTPGKLLPIWQGRSCGHN